MFNSPNAILKGISAKFAKGLINAPESQIKAFTEFFPSTDSFEDYWIPYSMPSIKEWVDEINFKEVEDFLLRIQNKDWQNGLQVKRNTINDSKKSLGNSIESWIRTMIKQYVTLPDTLINDLLVANGTAFDGSAFFADTRPLLQGTNAIDNIYDGTGLTLTLVEADLSGARARLKGFRDINNQPLNRGAKLVVYAPVALETIFLKLANNEDVLDNTNIHKGTFELIINYDDTTGDEWYLINSAAAMKPFVYQTREEPKFVVEDNQMKKNVDYAVTSRSNVGYGHPASIVWVQAV